MADKRVEIEIRTSGDTSGTDQVAKGLDNVAASASKAAGSGGVGGFSAKLQAMFPTFTAWGSKLSGVTNAFLASINPMTALTAAVGAAAAALVKAYRDSQRAEEEFLAIAGEGWKKQKLAVDGYLPTQSALITGLRASADSIGAVTERLAANEGAIAKALASEAALAESAKNLSLARIQLAESEGRISEAEAERQRARVEATSAEEEFARQTNAANAILEQRRTTLAAVTAEMQKLQAQREAMVAAAEEAGQGNVRDQADGIDPKLNLNVDQARSEVAAALTDAETSLQERIDGFIAAAKEAPNLAISLGGLALLFKRSNDEINTRVEAAQEDVKARQSELNDAIEARVQAIDRNAAASRDALNAVNAQIEAATQRLEAVKASVFSAEADVRGMQPGGAAATVFQNNQAAGAINNLAAGTTPISPADVAGAGDSAARQQFLAAIADGIQQRELVFLDQLLGILRGENTGNNAVQERLKRVEEQINLLRSGL